MDFDGEGNLVGIDIDRASKIVNPSRIEAESLPITAFSFEALRHSQQMVFQSCPIKEHHVVSARRACWATSYPTATDVSHFVE